jgi:hypothetical protein
MIENDELESLWSGLGEVDEEHQNPHSRWLRLESGTF